MYEIRCKRTKQPSVYGISKSTWNEAFASKTFCFSKSYEAQVRFNGIVWHLPSLDKWKDIDVLSRKVRDSMECWEDYGAYKRRWL